MDPKTVIFVLALNLLTVGTLLALIGRRMDRQQGMRGFATGSLVFGLSYLLRLATGHQQTSLLSVLPDTLMACATLCFITGLRHFIGLTPLGSRRLLALTAAYGVASTVAVLGWQDLGRHVVLNAMLALHYGLLSGLAAWGMRRVHGAMTLSLLLLSVVIGLLAVLTGLRVPMALAWGPPALFNGPVASAYYGYSTFTSVVLGPNLLWMVFLRLNVRLEQLATHDALTGLLNRHGLDEALQRHFAARPAAPLRLCQFDIDHFKRINDQHGHGAGDAVLRSVAAILQAEVRGADFVARLGGEEFVIGCAGGRDAALALAERVRERVAERAHRAGLPAPLRCTLSAGVSPEFDTLAQWPAALRLADEALYRAKAGGRNAVCLARLPQVPEAPPAGGAAPAAADWQAQGAT